MPPNRRLSSAACCALFVVASSAGATSQRTFVAPTGVDNPACSIGAPCRSFAAAITATNAGGEIIVQDSAGYGPVTITKSISIISPPGIYGGISVFSGNGVTINAPVATVVLRGLSINGQGGTHGILVQAAARTRIESCVVSNMGAVGIYHQATGETIVLDTIARDNADTGLAVVAGGAAMVLDHVRSEHNTNAGLYIAPVVGGGSARATISDSVISNNGGTGIWADTVGSAHTFIYVTRSTLLFNSSDGFQATSAADLSGAFVTLRDNTISGGVYLRGDAPGKLQVSLAGNSVSSSIIVDGSAATVWVAGNSGDLQLLCQNGGSVHSLGNNQIIGGVACGSYSVGGGV